MYLQCKIKKKILKFMVLYMWAEKNQQTTNQETKNLRKPIHDKLNGEEDKLKEEQNFLTA